MYIGSENQKINPYHLKFPFSFVFGLRGISFWLHLVCVPFLFGRLLISFGGDDNEWLLLLQISFSKSVVYFTFLLSFRIVGLQVVPLILLLSN